MNGLINSRTTWLNSACVRRNVPLFIAVDLFSQVFPFQGGSPIGKSSCNRINEVFGISSYKINLVCLYFKVACFPSVVLPVLRCLLHVK